jgi:hypothetical protein
MPARDARRALRPATALAPAAPKYNDTSPAARAFTSTVSIALINPAGST